MPGRCGERKEMLLMQKLIDTKTEEKFAALLYS
jgi:hypothetical protein